MTDTVAQLSNISKGFNDGLKFHQVLDQVELSLQSANTVALTGPSGSGKSTLLNLIAGFEKPDSGTLWLDGQSTANWNDANWSLFRRQQLGVVFQQFNLLTPLNVQDNIAFSLRLNGQDWNPWCQHLVDKMRLSDLLSRSIDTLSGGQQQRVAIARALAHKPKLLLADEPTGNLDNTAGIEVMQLLVTLASEVQTSILMVTHSEECAQFMQRRWRLEQGHCQESSHDAAAKQLEPINE